MKIFTYLRTVWFIINLILATFFLGLILMSFGLIDRNLKLLPYLENFWGKWLIKSAGIKLQVSGLDNIDSSRQYIFVSNHASMLDVPITMSILNRPILFMTKKELFKIPFFGWMLMAAGMIRVNRQNKSEARKSIERAAEALKGKNASMLIYPEGTRSQSGALQRFKKGCFILSIKSSLPIVPISLVGTSSVLFKHSLLLNPGKISIQLHPPIETSDLTLEDRDELLLQVQNSIISGLQVKPM